MGGALRVAGMLFGKIEKELRKKLEEILASPPLKRRPVTMLNPGKMPFFFCLGVPFVRTLESFSPRVAHESRELN